MRTVLKDHYEVCHIWAQQKQRVGRASNIFFDGPSIYSYGHHCEMARFILPDVVFVTTKRYSVSTTKHIRLTLNAVSHKQVFIVPSMENHDENVKHYIQEIHAKEQKVKASVYYANLNHGQLLCAHVDLGKYLDIFGKQVTKEVRKSARKLLKLIILTDYTPYINKCEERKRKVQENQLAELEKRKAKALEYLQEWKNGGILLQSMRLLPIALRVKDGNIETSRGASVPIHLAMTLYALIKLGKPVHGLNLGHYTVTNFDGKTLRVGCHDIDLAEMDRIAALIPTQEVEEVQA